MTAIKEYCDHTPELVVDALAPTAYFSQEISSTVELHCKFGYVGRLETLVKVKCVEKDQASGVWKGLDQCVSMF